MGYGPRGVSRFVKRWGIPWIGLRILVYYSMGKTFNASVDWLGMVENPDQDADPSVNGGKAQKGGDYPTQADIDQFHALNNENYLLQQRQAVGDNINTLLEHNVDMYRPDVSRYEKLNPLKNCWYENTCVEAVKNGYKWAGYNSGIPDNVYDNKTFFKNYKDYGFDLIDVKDVSDIKKGDVLQYYTDAAQHDFSENHWTDRRILGIDDDNPILDIPENQYHMGIYVGDGMYWGDGSEDEPALVANIYKHKDGSSKDKFRVFRKKKADYISKKQDGGSLPKAQFGWNDFEESKIGKFVDAKGLRRDGEHMMNTIGDYFGYENTAEDARRMGLDASAMVNPLPDFINAYDHAQQGKHTDAALYAMFGILPFSAGPLVKGTKKAFNYLKNTNPLGKNAKIAKELSETLDAATLRNTTSKVDKKIIPFEKTNSEKLHKVSGKDIKESLDNEAFVNQAKIFNSPDKLPLTRVLDSKGLTMKDGKLFSKTGDNYFSPEFTSSRNTTHWSYGHIGDPGHGSWSSKSTAIINDFDNLKKSGHAMDLDPTDTYFYTKGDFEIPSNSLILTRDKKLYNKIKKESNITNIKLFENTPNDEFKAIVDSYSTKGPKKYNYQGDLFNQYIHKNWEQGIDVAQYKPARYLDFSKSKGIKDHFGGGSSKMHSVDPTFNIESIVGLGYNKNHGLYSEIQKWPDMRDFGKGIGSLDAMLEFPKPMQIFEMDKFLRLYKNKPEALKIQKQLAEMNGFKSYKEFKESVDMTNFKKYGGQLQKAQNGTETERQKYIQFALDTESGYHYIRNKDSAVKKLGSDGKWDGKTYYKIYEDGKYYPHYVGDEKRATIGHGHAPVDRDILDEYKDGIDETQALDLLGEDIDEKLRLSEIYYNQRFGDNKWDDLTESEQFMLNDYTFNVRGGFHKTFKNFAKAIHDKDFKSAKKEYKRALGERNEIFMNTYLKPWMDIQEEKTTVAPSLEDMPLPIGTYPVDMTEPQKKETSWWRGEEGWIPDELELPWFMDGAGVNAKGSGASSAIDIPDGAAAENATMSRSAMDPMPSLNNDLTINDNLALSNTISDLSEETTIAKYGGQYMWGLDLRSTKAQAGKEVKSDDIYANDRYSQSAAKYKRMLPKYQSQGQLPKAQFGRHSIMSGNAYGLRPEGSTGVLGDFYDQTGISDGKYKWLLGDTKTGGASGAFVSNILDIANIPSNLMAEATEYFGERGDKEFNFSDAMPGFSGDFSFTNMYGEPTKTVSGTVDDQGKPLVDNFWGGLAVDIFTDPTSYVGLGLVTKGSKLPNAIGKTTRNVEKGLGNAKININNAMSGTKMTKKGLQIWDGEDWVLSNKEQALNTIKKIIAQSKQLQNDAANKVTGAKEKLANLQKNKQKLISDFEKIGFDTKELHDEAYLDVFAKYVKFGRGEKFQQSMIDDMTTEFWEYSDFLDNVDGNKFDDLLDAISDGKKIDDELVKKHLSKSAYERFKNIKKTLEFGRQYDKGKLTRIK